MAVTDTPNHLKIFGMTTDFSQARAALDVALANWDAAKAYLARSSDEYVANEAIPSKYRADILKEAIQREHQAETAWRAALKELKKLAMEAGIDATQKEDWWVDLRCAVLDRSTLVDEAASLIQHGKPIPKELADHYQRACDREREIILRERCGYPGEKIGSVKDASGRAGDGKRPDHRVV